MNELTQYQKEQLPLLLIKGCTIKEVSELFNVPAYRISTYLQVQLERNLHVPLLFNSKTIPYHEDEMDYASTPVYDWDEISKEEKNILKITNQRKNKEHGTRRKNMENL